MGRERRTSLMPFLVAVCAPSVLLSDSFTSLRLQFAGHGRHFVPRPRHLRRSGECLSTLPRLAIFANSVLRFLMVCSSGLRMICAPLMASRRVLVVCLGQVTGKGDNSTKPNIFFDGG
jgi:hypothetical protein